MKNQNISRCQFLHWQLIAFHFGILLAGINLNPSYLLAQQTYTFFDQPHQNPSLVPTIVDRISAGDDSRDAAGQSSVGTGPAAAKQSEAKDFEDKPTRIDPFWKNLPVLQPPQRTGNTGVPPSGDGYYSLLEAWQGNYRESPPPSPYPPFALMAPSFFDVNWTFLDDPEKSWGWSDGLKRQPIGNNWLLTTGGSAWWRYMNETNARLSGVNQDFDLIRTRLYADLSYLDRARFFVEYLDAHRFGGVLPPLPIDENRSDFLNLFVDLNLNFLGGVDWHARLGRQELNFGSQRLVSTLDWANTRRTFEGVRFFQRTKETDWDLWWSQPVVVDRSSIDQVDGNQHFVGIWKTDRPNENQTIDRYYMFLGNSAPRPEFGTSVPGFNQHTFGSRLLGRQEQLLYDYELMFQLGNRGDQDIFAGAATVGHGYHFKNMLWSPTMWAYYDFASGDRSPGEGSHNTFNPLFPFGHYYLGFADIVNRQNIHDVNLHWISYPSNWVTLITQYHYLTLASSRDAIYNLAGAPVLRDPTGGAGRTIGNEIDFLANFHISPHADVMVGYSKLFAGNFLQQTGPGNSPELFYLQMNYRW